MSVVIGKYEFRNMMLGAVDKVRKGSEYLSQLDAVGGDGDHGATMLRAMAEVEKTLAAQPESASLGEMIAQVGWAILGIDGGATGPLLGSFFLGVADAVGDRTRLDAAGLADAFAAGGVCVKKQSNAELGDKTMLDALLPGLSALVRGAEAGRDAAQALQDAAGAAARGAEATRNWIPKFGKARFAGERTRGHPDPGATSLAMTFAGFAAGILLPASTGAGEPKGGHRC